MTTSPKTRLLLNQLRRMKRELRLSADAIRDNLNEGYLEHKISTGAVRYWLQGLGSPNSECTLALVAYIKDNQKKPKQTKQKK